MITLRVVVDQMVAPVPGSVGRYTEELTRALIETAPAGCEVQGIVSSSPVDQYEKIEAALPGLVSLTKTTLARRELAVAWSLGVTASSGSGMIHAPSLLAPLRRHDRLSDGTQVAVTIHDVMAWTHPESLTPTTVAWTKTMAKRARKYADAIVVPSHAVATQLTEIMDFGDRVRVIGSAVGSGLVLPSGSLVSGRVAALGLPSAYIAATGTLDPRKGITALITALGLPGAPDLPLVVIGPDSWGELDIASVADEAGLEPGRVRAVSGLSDEDLAIVIARAAVFVYPSLEEGFALPIIEAFHLGTPVVHSDAPALVEAAGDAGLVVARADAEGYSERLAAALSRVLTETELEQRLRIYGSDRAKAFSWRDSAELVWQLHADL
ncbi:glycosyltransferase family 4 protein [Cryobacterium psychrophilum]|uniref:Glycosyltransferase family 1 protein n=1 Tax=Cryobacterium psychrophilum TaxID=41988 RepID=A0A4Y8KMZ3_9MICO|nr:glycosyltransferase family 1 protein [Cryobacterium psychrophilum]TDW30679.1 glycosyltransferase involved in cell wall biosynthesis [Cryobacterium psychrophilum]TFD77094.1 glycosyltransferase family 1 protein [Cryobacterium psychrophilum]